MRKKHAPGCPCCDGEIPPCGGELCVTVVSCELPLEGATVTVTRGAYTDSGTTDVDGLICFEDMPGGAAPWTVTVEKAGYVTEIFDDVVIDCDEVELPVTLDCDWPATVTLTDPESNAITLTTVDGASYTGSHSYPLKGDAQSIIGKDLDFGTCILGDDPVTVEYEFVRCVGSLRMRCYLKVCSLSASCMIVDESVYTDCGGCEALIELTRISHDHCAPIAGTWSGQFNQTAGGGNQPDPACASPELFYGSEAIRDIMDDGFFDVAE